MILVDANILVYAYASSLSQHAAARSWLDEQLFSASRLGLPWSSVLAFVRLVTNPRLFSQPTSMSAAWTQVQTWLDAEAAWTPLPTARHRALVGACLGAPGLRANDVPDADLAALAIEHGLRLATTDGGFARFPGLAWFDPLG